MSTAAVQNKSQKSKKEKDKERDKERKSSLPQQTERLKTVVRRLPPNLPEEIFWQTVQEWVTDETVVWKIYCPGKLRKKMNKENIPSRAYIAFRDEEQLAAFSRGYDGHIFRDKAGVESQAVVEFAPYPKIPSEKRKADPRNGTIEKDEDYISFLETLKAAENAEPVSLESLIASAQPAPPPKTTPLLEALKAEKSANKDKEAILRNHAHYNNILRKEEKKKGAAAPASKKGDNTAGSTAPSGSQSSSKKGKKAQVNAASATSASTSQSAKNPPQGSAANGKNTANSSAAANAPAKPGKTPRPPRGGQNKAATTTKDAPRTETPTILTASASAVNTPPAALPTTSTPAPAGALGVGTGRRARPVIGLASRQFEAALSGVSGLANAATERKRRERERDAQAAAGAGGGAAAASSVPPTPTAYARIDGSDTDRPAPPEKANTPTSPKKDKGRRGGKSGGGSGATSGASANAPQVKVPSILQRAPDTAQNDAPATSTSTKSPGGAGPAQGAAVTEGSSGGRGGRRGRGGGRGRGAAPANAPRGG